jgi:hypothetical protein
VQLAEFIRAGREKKKETFPVPHTAKKEWCVLARQHRSITLCSKDNL